MLKTRTTAEQIQLREGLEPTLVANEIASAVALGEGLPETFFDYGCVPQESRAEVYELTKSVKDARGRHLAVIVNIGALRRAKELLGHGNFQPWLKAEVRWSERTARNYMSLAAHFQGKTANFADLDLGTARELIDSPAEVSEPIMRRAEAGETISQEEVKRLSGSAESIALPSRYRRGHPQSRLIYRNRGSPSPQPKRRPRG